MIGQGLAYLAIQNLNNMKNLNFFAGFGTVVSGSTLSLILLFEIKTFNLFYFFSPIFI